MSVATSASQTSDDRLDRVNAGDLDAQRRLIERYGPLVWSLCRRLDPEPDDAYQEVWEKVFRGLRRFDPHGSAKLSTWISVVTHRHLVDRHRKRSTRGVEVDLENHMPQTRPVEDRLDRAARVAALERALGRLPEGQRRVVVLHHLRGLPLEAIAEGEMIAVGTVKSRLHRARARLTQILGGAS